MSLGNRHVVTASRPVERLDTVGICRVYVSSHFILVNMVLRSNIGHHGSVLLLLATPAIAAGWADGFKVCDADGSGTVSRSEWNACEAKLDPQMNPTFYDDGHRPQQQRR